MPTALINTRRHPAPTGAARPMPRVFCALIGDDQGGPELRGALNAPDVVDFTPYAPPGFGVSLRLIPFALPPTGSDPDR
jgi:hypothetical protein